MLLRVSKTAVTAMLAKMGTMTVRGLDRIMEDDSTPLLEKMVGSVIRKCIEDGDAKTLNFFFDRLIGKVRETEPEDDRERKEIIDLIPTETILKLING